VKPLEAGEEVIVKGERGVFTVRSIRNEKDGDVIGVFGGDRNPLGRRSFRFFTADRVRRVPTKRSKNKKGGQE
jgi:hypothetical protein